MILRYNELKEIVETSNQYQIPTCFKPTGWELSSSSCKFLANLIKVIRPECVLEFGSGHSSLVMANELEKVDHGKLISIDNSRRWSQKVGSQRPPNLQKKLMLYVFPLVARIYHKKFLIFYDIPKKFYQNYPKFDFVLVDGPHQDVSREAALYESFEQVKKGGIFIIDDSNSDHMQKTIGKWQRALGDIIEVKNFQDLGNGLCIITKKIEITQKVTFQSKELIADGVKFMRNLYRVKKLHLNQ